MTYRLSVGKIRESKPCPFVEVPSDYGYIINIESRDYEVTFFKPEHGSGDARASQGASQSFV